jgi:serine/threonine protein kinase
MDLSLAIDKDKVEKLEQSATPGFIAPEVFTDYQYDSKVDVYSVGVILFSMLSGSFVFSNEVVN